jgi:hypothetical protein
VYSPLFYLRLRLNCDFQFAIFSIRRHKAETSNGEINGGRKTYNINTHSLRERNGNSSSQSSGGGSPVRKVVSRSKGSENVARAKRKLNTYDIADIIDSEVSISIMNIMYIVKLFKL